MMQISQGTIGSPWHQAYHSSSPTTDHSSYDHGYLRRSPDQYSSRGSMESLEHTSAYHPCHLTPAKSTNCIDQLAHLHSKRDSAYSSFSTNSSIPEYHPSNFSKERSYSMESMHTRGNLQEGGIRHADIKYIKTVYDVQRGVSEEYEVNSSTVKNRSSSRLPGYNRNCGAPAGKFEQSRVFSESNSLERGPPMPPTRSDSYAVTRHHERPSSWSSIDQNRSFRTHPKATGLHPVGAISCNSNQQFKPVFGEGQLHTVLEKSPECSPMVKPKQIYSQAPQPGQPMLPTGIYPVPSPEPQFAHAPQASAFKKGRLYPALAKEGGYGPKPSDFIEKVASCSQFDNEGRISQNLQSRSTVLYPMGHSNNDREKRQEGPASFAPYKLHFTVDPDIAPGPSTKDENELNVQKMNQYVDTSEHLLNNGKRIATQSQTHIFPEEQSKTEVQEFPVTVEGRTESAFQNEWNYSKTKLEISTPAINMESDRNQYSTDTQEEMQWEDHINATPSLNNTVDNRHSQQKSDQRNKLESPSFTKLIEDADNSIMLCNNQLKSEEPSSPSQKKTYDFTRRRLSSSSTKGDHGFQYGKQDANKRSSVLERISKIEQREQESQRSQSSSGSIYGHLSGQCTRGSNTRGSVNSIEEIRNKFNSQEQVHASDCRRLSSSNSIEKATNVYQLNSAGSVYSIKSEGTQKQMLESQVEKMQQNNNEQYVLQAVTDGDTRTADTQTKPNKEDHWQSTAQDTLGFSKVYRNSIKDAQSKVLEATSYRRKDLEFSPPQQNKQEKSVKRPTSALLQGKTSSLFPHVPKERHIVTPTDTSATVQDFQSKESQGASYQLTRIGARRRLTAEQKKRSYSEPEKMNEVGASDNESSPLNVQKGGQNLNFLENTVADRRRMFERDGKACSTVNLSKPELKQFQQNALADYIERKTGRRPSSQESGLLKERSQSIYFSGSVLDSQSVSSSSSMNSLQDHNLPYHRRDPREPLCKTGRVSSTLPPGLTGVFDMSSFEQNAGRQESRNRSSSFAHQLRSERLLDYRSKTEFAKSIQTDRHREITSSKAEEFENVPGTRNPGKSASAEDLLDRFEQQPIALHVRSRSSPAGYKKGQDFMVGKDIGEQSSSYAFANQGFRIPKSKDGGHTEKAPFQITFQSHPDHSSIGGENQPHPTGTIASQPDPAGTIASQPHPTGTIASRSTRQVEIQKHTRTQSLTPTAGMHNPRNESRQVPLPLSSLPNSSKIAQSTPTHTTTDFYMADEFLYTGKNGKTWAPPVEDVGKTPLDWRSHDNNSLEELTEEARIKRSAPPQMPPPSKIKCANSVNEDHCAQNNSYCPLPEHKLSPRGKSCGMWSSSSSEPETAFHHGKISLRISESYLLSTAPVVGQDDEDDEVFIKEQEIRKFTEAPITPPSPPPFPAPVLEDALFHKRIDAFPPAPASLHGKCENNHDTSTQVKEDVYERYPYCVDEMAKAAINMEKSGSRLFNSGAPMRDAEFNLIRPSSTLQVPQHTATTVEAAQNSAAKLLNQPEETSIRTAQNSGKDNPTSESHSTLTYINTNLMTPEDVKSRELAKEIVNKDKSLADILDPESKMKTTMDLMEGLFSKSSNELKTNNIKRKKMKMLADKITSEERGKKEQERDNEESVVNCSAYYAMSASKAGLLKITATQAEAGEEKEQLGVNEKKAELIARLTHKLEILQEAKESLLVDIKLNNSLGEEVEALIESLCKPNEFDKYKMFVGDLDKVVNLLLSLSGRLARVENLLCSLGEDTSAEERNSLNEKRKLLSGQHEDARELKENLDRREKVVMDILRNYLTEEQFQNYQHFVKMKSALLIEQRELDDKNKLGQEQVKYLLESLPSDFQIGERVPLPRGSVCSVGNINIPPP
ncbi:protein Shroom3 isoform X3 [Ascaphus truei]